MAEFLNFTTGPVNIAPDVASAFASIPFSHRSQECRKLIGKICYKFSQSLHVKETFLLSGSGTLANEAMIAQIAATGTRGLILSNGEFGDRLIRAFSRHHQNFDVLRKDWGAHFSEKEINQTIGKTQPCWLLCCHHETSTGVLNDLDLLSSICVKQNMLLYADCISSIGNIDLDLSKLAMATGSSGKGLASYPGLAFVFSTIEVKALPTIPSYLDLHYYKQQEQIPFTISTNQLMALDQALNHTLNKEHYQKNKKNAALLKAQLQVSGVELLNTSDKDAFVFSIVLPEKENSKMIGHKLKAMKIAVSYESHYLQERNIIQCALMGMHEEKEIYELVEKLEAAIGILNFEF